jgi:streptogramin lyase
MTVAGGSFNLATSPSGAHSALSVPEEGRVQLLDIERMRRGVDIELGVDARPSGLAFIDEDRLLIGSSSSGKLSLYDSAYGRITRVFETGAESTTELSVQPAEQSAWLLDPQTGRVLRLSWERAEIRRSKELGEGLVNLAQRPASNELWVLSNASDRIIVLEKNTLGLLGEIPCAGGPRALAFDQHDAAWVACGDSDEVVRINAETGEFLAHIPIPAGRNGDRARPVDILLDPESNRVWVACPGSGSLQIIDQLIERCVAEVDGLLQPVRMNLAQRGDR